MFSGRTNYVGMQFVEDAGHKERLEEAYLVELIAEVYGVDVVTLEVGEHDYLDKALARKMASKGRIRTKKTMVKRRPAAIRTEKRKSHPRGTEGKGSKRSDPAPERRKRAQTCTTHDDR